MSGKKKTRSIHPSRNYNSWKIFSKIRESKWNICRKIRIVVDSHENLWRYNPVLCPFPYPRAENQRGKVVLGMRPSPLHLSLVDHERVDVSRVVAAVKVSGSEHSMSAEGG